MKTILIFGGKGQLGQCLQKAEGSFPNLSLIFLSAQEANITDPLALAKVFEQHDPEVVINCAAYTAVDLAEDELEQAQRINTLGPALIAKQCAQQGAKLLHLSTDFVFSGNQASPLTEDDPTGPLGVYGRTKLAGEQEIIKNTKDYLIFRTSWLYSEFGSNFVKTMLRLGKDRESLGVVYDQIGTPTYAMDLAHVLLKVASEATDETGVFHYSNEGVASWYDFAHAVFRYADMPIRLHPLSSAEFPTKAQRPSFSVMDKSKIKRTFSLDIPHWQDSLGACIIAINQINK